MSCKYIYKGIEYNSEEEFQEKYIQETSQEVIEETKDDIQDKIDFFKDKFKEVNINVEVKLDNSISSIGQIENIEGIPTITINPDRIKGDTITHEFSHLFIDLLGYDDITVQKAINSLRNTQLYKDIRDSYPELLDNQEALDKEVLVTALGREANKYYNELNETKQKIFINRIWDKLVNLFNKWLDKSFDRNHIKQLVRKFVDDKIQVLNNNTLSPYIQRQKNRIDELIIKSEKLVKKDNDEGESNYYLGNKKFDRVTNKISKYIEDFKPHEKATELIEKAITNPSKYPKYTKLMEDIKKVLGENKLKENTIQYLKDLWSWKADSGTYIHKIAEEIFEGKSFENLYDEGIKQIKEEDVYKRQARKEAFREGLQKLFNVISQFKNSGNLTRGAEYYSEVTVYDEELGVAGTIDLLELLPNGEVNIYDFKTKESGSFSDFNRAFNDKRLLGAFHEVLASKENQYGLQLSLYKLILERQGIKVHSMNIIPIEADVKIDLTKGDKQRFKYENIKLGEKELYQVPDFSDRLQSDLHIPVTKEQEETKFSLPKNKFINNNFNRLYQLISEPKSFKLFKKNKRITEEKTMEKLINNLKELLEQRKRIYEGKGFAFANTRQINDLIRILEGNDHIDAMKAIYKFAFGEKDTLEYNKMGELDKIRAMLFGQEVISHYEEGKIPVYQKLTSKENYWFYLNSLGTIEFYKQLLEFPIDFVIEDSDQVKNRQEILRLLQETKGSLSYSLTELENNIREAFKNDILFPIAQYTSDPKLLKTVNNKTIDSITNIERDKTEEERIQDLDVLFKTVFSSQADLNKSQFWLSWAGESNDKFIALMVKTFEIGLNKANMEANEKKRDLKKLIDKVKDIDWLFEKTDKGVLTRRFVQPFKVGWLEKYLELKNKSLNTVDEFDKAKSILEYRSFLFTNCELTREGKDAINEYRKKEYNSSTGSGSNSVEFAKGWKQGIKDHGDYPSPKPDYFKRNKIGGYIPIKTWENTSKAWKDIQNNPDKLALYNEIQTLMEYGMEYVKGKERFVSSLGFVPSISKDVISGPKEFINRYFLPNKEEFKEKIHEISLDEFGSISRMIPFYYATKDIREFKDEELPFDKANFTKALYMFTDAAYEFREKSIMEPKMLLTLNEKKNSIYYKGKVDKEDQSFIAGKKILRGSGKDKPIQGEDASAVKQLRSFILNNLYDLDKNEDDSKLAAKISALLMNHMSITNLALNWRAGIADLAQGHLTTYIEANSGKNFNKKDWLWAMKKVTNPQLMADYSMSNGPEFPTKDCAILNMLHILQDAKELNVTRGAKLRNNDWGIKSKIVGKNILFLFENSAEWHSQNAILFAMMRNEKLINSEGKEVSLYDAIEYKDGIVSLGDNYKTKDSDILAGKEKTLYLANFQRKALHINHKLQGRYTKEHQSELQRYWWGRLMMHFRKHMWNNWRERFGSRGNVLTGPDEFWNEAIDERDKGRYFTYGHVIRELFKAVMKANLASMKEIISKKNFSEEDWQDIRKTNTELLMIASLGILIWALRSLDDEDEVNNFLYNSPLNTLDRIYSNLGAFVPITADPTQVGIIPELYRTAKSPAASLQMVHNIYNFMYQTLPWNWSETYEGGPYRDSNKLFIMGGKLLPVSKEIISLQFLEQNSNFYKRH